MYHHRNRANETYGRATRIEANEAQIEKTCRKTVMDSVTANTCRHFQLRLVVNVRSVVHNVLDIVAARS
jgi:hypothetical protein